MPNNRVDGIQAFVSPVIPESADSDDDASLQPKDPVHVPDVNKEGSPMDIRTTIQDDDGATTKFGVQDLAELHVILNAEQLTTLSAQDDLIQWHHCLGYLPYDLIRSMSRKGFYQSGYSNAPSHSAPPASTTSSRGSLGNQRGCGRIPLGKQLHPARSFPLTNSSHQQRASLLNSRASSQNKGTGTQQCLWTNIHGMPTST